MARESDLGPSLGLGPSSGGVAQLVVACVRESAMREGAQGGGGGLVMSVQQGEVVGETECWPRPRPRVCGSKRGKIWTAGGRLVLEH